MHYRDNPQQRLRHHIKWTGFTPPNWTDFAPPLTLVIAKWNDEIPIWFVMGHSVKDFQPISAAGLMVNIFVPGLTKNDFEIVFIGTSLEKRQDPVLIPFPDKIADAFGYVSEAGFIFPDRIFRFLEIRDVLRHTEHLYGRVVVIPYELPVINHIPNLTVWTADTAFGMTVSG